MENEEDVKGSILSLASVTVDGEVAGEISDPDDQDWFRVTLEAGKMYRVRVSGYPEDGTLSSPLVAGIHDANGRRFAHTESDEHGLSEWDAAEYFSPAVSGLYFVAVGTDDRASDTGTYKLQVSDVTDDYPAIPSDDFLPTPATTGKVAVGGTATGRITNPDGHRDHDWFAVTLEAGKHYRVEIRGESSGDGTLSDPLLAGLYGTHGQIIENTRADGGGEGRNALLYFTPEVSGTYHVSAASATSDGGTYTVAVEEMNDPDPPSVETAPAMEVGKPATGTIDNPYDTADWFRVTLEAGKLYRIEVKGAATDDGTLTDPVLIGLHDAQGRLFAGSGNNNGGEGRNSLEYFQAPSTGTYHVAVKGEDWDTGTYTVLATEAKDDFRASTATTGVVAVGGTTKGTIDIEGETDWIRVELVAGKTYRIDVKGSWTGHGTLQDPQLLAIRDSAGRVLPGTRDSDDGVEENASHLFTPQTSGTYYIEVGGARGDLVNSPTGIVTPTGTYTVGVREDGEIAASIRTTATIDVVPDAYPYTARGAGNIETVSDVDWHAVELIAGTSYVIDVQGDYTAYDLGEDKYLKQPMIPGVYDAQGQLVPGTTDINSDNDNYARVHFTPQTSGTYYVGVKGNGVVTGVYEIAVSVPGDTPAGTSTPRVLPVGGSLRDRLEKPHDEDWFAITLVAGTSYRFEMKGMSTGDGSLRDPEIGGIHDASGHRISGTYADDGGEGRNSLLDFAPATSGTYYLAVEGLARFYGTYKVQAGITPNDTPAGTSTTRVLPVGAEIEDEIEVPNDQDWFAVTLEAGRTYRIEVRGSSTADGTLPDPMLAGIHDASGRLVAGTRDDDSGQGKNSLKDFTPGTSGTYYVVVQGWDGREPGTYKVTALDLSAPHDGADAEPIRGTPADDRLQGGAQDDAIDARGGDDRVLGLAGGDRIWGRDGADILHGHTGHDRIWGGPGNDRLYGGEHRDRLWGEQGRDVLDGGRDADRLWGGRGDDSLHGGRGDDRLDGGRGDDVLSGGIGSDRFVYDERTFGQDRIVDFEDGTDLLDFRGSGLQWSDLSVSSNRGGDAVVRVTSAHDKIVLEGIDAALIGQDDFLF